jgi:hypothetical protein
MMQQHNGYWISGSAIPGPPYMTYWEALGIVLESGRGSSVLEVARLHLTDYTIEIKELSEWFGLELARIIVDQCLPARVSE